MVIDAISSIPEALKAIAEAFTTAVKALNAFQDRRRAAKEATWLVLRDAIATAKTIVGQHLEAARIMTAPARINGDLAGTAILLRQFVDSGTLPLAYDELHGVLEQLIRTESFHQETRTLMRSLRTGLALFQTDAFMVRYSSWQIADAVEAAVRLIQELPKQPRPISQISDLKDSFGAAIDPLLDAWDQFHDLPGKPIAKISFPEPLTPEIINSVVCAWFKAWFEHVQQALYAGQGISRLIGQLSSVQEP